MTTQALSALSTEALRRTFSCFPSGVTFVCGLNDGEPVGLVVSSFTSVSLDPPMISVCIADGSTTWPALRSAPTLGVSVLGQKQDRLCRQLASSGGDRLKGVRTKATPGGAVILSGAVAWFECRLVDEVRAGDHLIALLQIDEMCGEPASPPLVFHGSGFKQLS